MFTYQTQAQVGSRRTIDSLINVLSTLQDDTNKVKVLEKISYIYSGITPDSGIRYGYSTLNLAKKLGWNKGIAVANADLGFNYKTLSEYDSALKHEEEALEIYQKLNLKSSEAAMLCNIASIYHSKGNYTKALNYNLQALKVFESLNVESAQAAILENIGSIFLEQQDYDKTRAYYVKALKINESLKDSLSLARNLGNIGIVYDKEGLYTEALGYHMQALAINKMFGNNYSVQLNHANIGVVYHHMNKISDALKHHLIALRISEQIKSKASIAVNSGNVGEMYLQLAKNTKDKTFYLNKSITFLETATKLCMEINHPAPLVEFSQHLSEAYALNRDYPKALAEYKFHSSIKDSLFSIQTKIKLSELELRREMDIKEKNLQIKENEVQILTLRTRQERHMRIIYLFGLILVLLVLAITIREIIQYRKSNKTLKVENERQYQDIEKRNMILEEIAHMHSHEIRSHVATILGLSELLDTKDLSNKTNETILNGVKESSIKLDIVLKDISNKKNLLNKF